MKQQKKLKVLLQVLFVSICVILLGGFSTMDTQAKAKKTYTVQFDKNGGKGKMSSKKYTIGKSYKLSKNKFTKKNYVFVGWNTKKSGKGKSYADQKKVKNLSTKEGATVTLYAQWKKGITVKFNANSGSVDKKSMLVVKGKKYGSYAKLPTASKAGYEFKGWYTKKNGGSKVTDKTKVKNKKKHTLYAQYKVINYNIYYHLDGGKNASNPTTYNVESNSIKLGTPTRAGYTFNGWYTDSAFTNKVDTIGKGSTGDLNLYASWSLANYEITYKLDGGSNNKKNPATYTVEDTITLKSPSKTGYTFNGWYTDSAYKNKVTKIKNGTTGNMTLYAKWTINTYSITYNLKGGTNDSANPSSYQVTSDTITLKPATKLGYTFDKWTKSEEGGTKVSRISKGSTGNITLYAQYTPTKYKITYSLSENGINHPMNPSEYTIEEKVILRKPTMERHRFEGFYKDAEFTEPITKLEKSYGDITVYAKWEYIPVTRAAWVAALVDAKGISISENDLPKDMDGNSIYTFADLDGSVDYATKMKIEAAAAYDIIPYEKDEEGGANYFDPNGAATREFVATSAVMALGFDTKDKVLEDCADANDITYKQHVAVALNQQIISKVDNNSFKPNDVLTEAAKDVAIAKIKEILESATVKATVNENEYKDDVIQIASGTSYLVECEDPSVSGNIITVSSNTVKHWKAGDKVVVTSTDISAFDDVQLTDENPTKTIVLPANDIFPASLALIVTDKVVSGDVVILTCKVPEDLSQVLTRINVAGVGEVDGSKVVAAEGVQAVYNPNGSISHNSIEDLDNAGIGVDVDGSTSMPGTISFTFDELELSKRTKISGNIEVGIPDISYRLNAGVDWGGVYVDDLYFAMTEEIALVGEIKTEGDPDNGKVEMGRVPFPLGPSGLTVDVVFWFNYNVSGTASITCTIQNTNGIQMINGDLRVIKDVDAQISAKAEATLEVGPKVSVMLTMFSVFDLVDITADGGLGVTASATSRTPQMELTCYDVGAYLYLKVSAGENSIIGELLGISYKWDIFDKETSPVKKMWHFEDKPGAPFQSVSPCSFGKGTIKGTVMDAETNQKIPNATVKIYTQSGILTKVLYTDSDGKYETQLYCGEYTFAISAGGYKSYQDVYSVIVNQTTYLEASLLIDKEYTEAEEGTASGKILDSVNGNEIKDATLNIRKGWNKRTGDIVYTSSTNNSGDYEVTLPLGNYTIEIVKTNYVTGYINIIVRETLTPNQNGELTPEYLGGDEEGILRVVLTWGETPRDLDSHILGPKMGDGTERFHVYYSDMNYYSDYSNSTPTVNLDRDDVTSYGPETVTVYQLKDTGTYSYYVHDYTNRYEDETNEMGEISKAKVKVYNGGQLVTTFSVPYGEGGTCWHVFDYDAETKVVTPVNTMSYISGPGNVGSEDNVDNAGASGSSEAQLEAMDMQTILDDMVEKKGNE